MFHPVENIIISFRFTLWFRYHGVVQLEWFLKIAMLKPCCPSDLFPRLLAGKYVQIRDEKERIKSTVLASIDDQVCVCLLKSKKTAKWISSNPLIFCFPRLTISFWGVTKPTILRSRILIAWWNSKVICRWKRDNCPCNRWGPCRVDGGGYFVRRGSFGHFGRGQAQCGA